jgi:hypothetical protein
MKRKTPNAQHRTLNAEVKKPRTKTAESATLNIEWGLRGFRVNDMADSEYGIRRQRSYDLEDRLLDFAVHVVELTVSRLKRLGEPANLAACLNEVEELIRIFAASVKTAEKNAKL